MLNRVGRWRHVAVVAAVLAVPILVALGVMGRGVHPERFDAKLVVVSPAGNGVHVHEVVDEDFGNTSRHGYERIIPNDFGAPTDVVASSPNAPDQLSVTDEGSQTRIRVGDPNVTTDGRHRYVLDFTLPSANLSSGQLALDIIGSDETLQTRRFEVVLTGFRLTGASCNVGPSGTVAGCVLSGTAPAYRVVFQPLKAGDGITVGGTITGLDPSATIAEPAPFPARSWNRWPIALIALGLGALSGASGFVMARRAGRNEVGGATAADAAFADPQAPVRLLTDQQLEALATTEFEPPRGLRPWHGALLLHEAIDNDTVSAWFSDQIAQQVIELQEHDGTRTLAAGAHLAESPPITRQRIDTLLAPDGSLELGKYQPRLLTLWKEIQAEQKVASKEAGWWSRGGPGSSGGALRLLGIPFMIGLLVLGDLVLSGVREVPGITIVAAILVPALAALLAYSAYLPRRSAAGSAVALQAESFRRFLEASEGKHVEWAWKHGLLREYSAWAVSLGAAAAWGRAIAASAVPPPELSMNTTPLLMYAFANDWHSTFTPPHQSGSGGGGFSSGFSGGGGGGGSSGSW